MSYSPTPAQPVLIPNVRPTRHALGLPAGSVRAMLALLVVGLICALALIPPRDPSRPQPIPAYLLYLLFLTLGHFFAAHGTQVRGEAGYSPLYLPGWVVRFVILGGLVAAFSWQYVNNPDILRKQLEESVDDMKAQPLLPLMLLGGFFIGVVVRTVVGRHTQAYWWQDIEAWFALIGVIGLCIAVLWHLVIQPSLNEPVEVGTVSWDGFLAAIVAFYFGARS